MQHVYAGEGKSQVWWEERRVSCEGVVHGAGGSTYLEESIAHGKRFLSILTFQERIRV